MALAPPPFDSSIAPYLLFLNLSKPTTTTVASVVAPVVAAFAAATAAAAGVDAAGDFVLPNGSDFVVECGCSTAPAPETSAPVTVVDPTAQPVAAPAVAAAATLVPVAADPQQPTGDLPTTAPTAGSPASTAVPTAGPTATDRGLEPSAVSTPTPTLSAGSDPIGVPDVVRPESSTPSPSGEGAAEGSCGATESFRITSSALPVVQGCFQSTAESFSNPGSLFEAWTVSGTADTEQIAVLAWAEGGETEVSPPVKMAAEAGGRGYNRVLRIECSKFIKLILRV